MTDLVASFSYAHKPKNGRQTLVYWVFDVIRRTHAFAWLDLDCKWLREEASLNDLKQLAIEETTK